MFLQKAFTGKNQWYWYVFTLLIVFTATQMGSLPLVAYMLISQTGVLKNETLEIVTNAGLALSLLAFAVGLVALLFCVTKLQGKKYTDIITGRHRIDWGRVFFGAGVWAVLTLLTFAIQIAFYDGKDIVFQFDPVNFFILLLISLTLFPFQTSFEELLFRGYLMQWSVILFKYKWVAIAVTGILFGLLHSANAEVKAFGMAIALPQYIIMGLVLGYIAVKDDGTELALGLHMANNILSALIFTSDASTLQTHALFKDQNPSASYMDIVYILGAGIIFIWICNKKYHFGRKIKLNETVKNLDI